MSFYGVKPKNPKENLRFSKVSHTAGLGVLSLKGIVIKSANTVKECWGLVFSSLKKAILEVSLLTKFRSFLTKITFWGKGGVASPLFLTVKWSITKKIMLGTHST